jgi:hypothetical protein
VWNSRAARKARPSFYPTIETALLAGAPWLAYQCPSCQLIGDVDLRTIDRHPMDDGDLRLDPVALLPVVLFKPAVREAHRPDGSEHGRRSGQAS